MELDFINRVIKTTLLLGALVFIFGSYYFDWLYSLGILIGSFWGCANLWLIRQFVVNYFTVDKRNVGKLSLATIIKFPLLYLVGYLILKLGWFEVSAPVIGFSLIFLVMFFKALGRLILENNSKNLEFSQRRVER